MVGCLYRGVPNNPIAQWLEVTAAAPASGQMAGGRYWDFRPMGPKSDALGVRAGLVAVDGDLAF